MRRLVLAPRWLQILIVVLLVLGTFFRFVNLGGKVYSQDEIYTSLRIAGYTTAEVKQQIFNGRVISPATFAKYQNLNPQKDIGDTIKSLAIEAPQYPPLYYVIARLWAQFFGNSITALRTLSATISLLIFPCAYWLCRELFKVPLSLPGIAIALIAISPIHLIYAQQAQPHVLWIVTILGSSASLVRALRLESTRQTQGERILNWGIYAITLALSFYTLLLSGFIAVTHGIYVLLTAKFRRAKTTEIYFMASLAGFLVFIPWFLVALIHGFQVKSASNVTTNPLSFIDFIAFLLIQVTRIFFDLNFNWTNLFIYLFTSFFLLITGYAIYFLWIATPEKSSLFIINLIVISTIILIIPSLIFKGIVTVEQSSLIPAYLGIQLAVTYLFSVQLYNGRPSRRQIWQAIFILVICMGVISDVAYSYTKTWWSNFGSYGNPQVATIVNQASRPLLISDSNNYGNIFSLSYLVAPQTRFQLVQGQNTPNVPKGFTDVFLLNSSDLLRKELAQKYKSQPKIVYKNEYYSLWRLSKFQNLR